MPHPPPTSPFAIYDARRFSQVIDEVIAGLKADKVWKGDLKQQRQIMLRFAWITGDLPLGDYDHRHVDTFKKALHKIPAKFRYGTPKAGPMSQPFEEATVPFQPVDPAKRRNLKTINRDLSTMSTVAKRLAETAWKPRIPNTVVLDFASATVAIKEEDSTELRPPWTPPHVEQGLIEHRRLIISRSLGTAARARAKGRGKDPLPKRRNAQYKKFRKVDLPVLVKAMRFPKKQSPSSFLSAKRRASRARCARRILTDRKSVAGAVAGPAWAPV